MEDMVSIALLFLIVIITVGIVIGISNPIIQTTIKSSDVSSAENDLNFINNYIRTVANEGEGSTRAFNFNSPKTFSSIPGEDAVQFLVEKTSFIDYLTRSVSGNLIYVAGSNVNCQETDGNGDNETDLVAENDKIKVSFRKVNGNIDTTNLLLEALQKTNGEKIYVGNFSVIINDDSSSAKGTGYTEISNSGKNLPLCQIHAYVNSTVDYDVYYKLYSGADFIVVEVRHIR